MFMAWQFIEQVAAVVGAFISSGIVYLVSYIRKASVTKQQAETEHEKVTAKVRTTTNYSLPRIVLGFVLIVADSYA